MPDKIQVKFELFGIGNLDNIESFILKPWAVNITNPMLFQLFENFLLFIPNTLFYSLIGKSLFLEHIDFSQFKHIRVLQDLPIQAFQNFGLNRPVTPNEYSTKRLKVAKINTPDKNEISAFYSHNWQKISPQLEPKYFNPLLNTWLRITKEMQTSNWFGLKKSMENKTIGFLRIYNRNSSFSGGTSLEYIIDKQFRNSGYALEAVTGLIEYLKQYSNALFLGAEVSDDNEYSRRILKRLNFQEQKTSPFNDDNFGLSLLDNLKILEKKFENGNVQVSLSDKYAKKYSRYLI